MTAARISGIPGGAGSFTVPSVSNPGAEWIVDWVSREARYCGCIAFTRNQTCRHTDEIEALLRDEQTVASTPETRAAAGRRLAAIEELFTT